jgi:hypothetical protein
MAGVKLTLHVILLLILTRELVLSNMSPIHLRCFYLHTITQNENERGNRESLDAAMDHGTNQTQPSSMCMPVVSEKMLSRWRVEAVARGGSSVT